MFKFIENAVADHRIRKIESELERDNATMGDIYELNTAMKLTNEGMNAGEAIWYGSRNASKCRVYWSRIE